MLITCENITKSYTDKILLDNQTLTVSSNDKIGINIKYVLAMDDNSIELPYVDEVNDELEEFGYFYILH